MKNAKSQLYVIHGRRDEHSPFAQTEQAVNQLQDKGVAIEFAPLEGATHFETGRYIQPLRAAVPWIRKVWMRQ